MAGEFEMPQVWMNRWLCVTDEIFQLDVQHDKRDTFSELVSRPCDTVRFALYVVLCIC